MAGRGGEAAIESVASGGGFFRRSITKNAIYRCKNGGHCEMDMYMRRKCQECRLKKCKAVGMLAEYEKETLQPHSEIVYLEVKLNCIQKFFLIEVQCKSKRLRKKSSFLCNIKMEDEGLDNKQHVSSTTKPLKVQEKLEFTPGEHQLIDHIVAAHQKCTIPLEEAKKFLQETTNPEENFLRLSESAVIHVQSSFNSGHVKLSQHNVCGQERNTVYSIEMPHLEESPTSTTTTGITEEFITALFYFYRSMGELNVTETEYALLVATTVFFSGCELESELNLKASLPQNDN
uniref:Uncharacterized protein n=1 Tax=Sphaerodactylus townsendi TaxID=933632 RepID=A0ACB8F5P7_9SAUR